MTNSAKLLWAAALSMAVVSSTAIASPDRHPHWSGRYLMPGAYVVKLPGKHQRFVHNGNKYAYFGGHYFVKNKRGYKVVKAPRGARVAILPPGYVSFWMGKRRYFYVNHTYYLWDEIRREYEVVAEPQGGAEILARNAPISSEIFAYPARGQSPQRQERDYYDCHVWSSSEVGFDPTLEHQNVQKEKDYRRAMTACLEGRGYSVK